MTMTEEPASQVRHLSLCLGFGSLLTLLAVVFDVGIVFVILALMATAITATSLAFELRERRSRIS
jgi:hypothetical protein